MDDEAFFAVINQYAIENTYKIATKTDFFIILREHSDADMSVLLTQYFENPPTY